MNAKRKNLLEKALEMTDAEFQVSPGMPALGSIKNQLEYLIDIETGKRTDRDLLEKITLGNLAARELGPGDLAEILFEVVDEVRAMRHGN